MSLTVRQLLNKRQRNYEYFQLVKCEIVDRTLSNIKDRSRLSSFMMILSKEIQWKYFGTDRQMEFVGGLVGVRQDSHSLFLRPEIGWVIREVKDRV